jgi:hypothetical protein
VGIVECYALEGPSIDSRCVTVFGILPDRPSSPTTPSNLYNEYRLIPGVKRQGLGVDHPPHLAPTLKKEYSYIFASLLSLHGRLKGKLNFYLLIKLVYLLTSFIF